MYLLSTARQISPIQCGQNFLAYCIWHTKILAIWFRQILLKKDLCLMSFTSDKNRPHSDTSSVICKKIYFYVNFFLKWDALKYQLRPTANPPLYPQIHTPTWPQFICNDKGGFFTSVCVHTHVPCIYMSTFCCFLSLLSVACYRLLLYSIRKQESKGDSGQRGGGGSHNSS